MTLLSNFFCFLAKGKCVPDPLPSLSTPHGVTASRDFVFFANSEAEGYADIGRDLHDPSTEGRIQPFGLNYNFAHATMVF